MPEGTDPIKIDVDTYETVVSGIEEQGKEIIDETADAEEPDAYAAGNSVVPDYQAYDERIIAVLKDLETEVAQLTSLMTDIKDEYLETDADADKELTQAHDDLTSGSASDGE